MKFLLRCFIMLSSVTVLAVVTACGQKGKLVMPPKPTPISTPYPEATPKPAEPDRSVPAEKSN